MTTQKLIQAIAKGIDGIFGDCEIYEDEIEQGLNEPCFLIAEIDNSMELVLGSRYKASHSFDIHYFPKENLVGEMHQVSDALFEILEYIDTGEGLLRGSNLRSNIQDGILHFFVDYEFFVMKNRKREEPMEELDARISKKG